MAKKQISQSGYNKLNEELDYLITVKRAEMAQKLKEARAQGDLSENAEYDEAKNEQAILEARIAEIQYTLDNSEVVDDDDISVDEVLGGIAPKANKLDQAKRLLLELAEGTNRMQSKDIFEIAKEEEISKRTLENAKRELNISAKKINNTWYWDFEKIKKN